MRLIQISDLHVTADPHFELKGINTRQSLDRVLAYVGSRYADADRLILTGDLTHDEQLQTYETIADLLQPWWWSKVRVLPGNHDDRQAMRQAFGELIQVRAERITFAESLGNWQLIGLDSHVPGELGGRIGDAQLDWLATELEKKRNSPTCIFMHHPPIRMRSAWLDKIGLMDADQLLKLIARDARVRLIVCGHVHQERTAAVEGSTIVVTSPSTGVQFRPDRETLEVDQLSPGIRIIDLDPAGNVSTWVERVG